MLNVILHNRCKDYFYTFDSIQKFGIQPASKTNENDFFYYSWLSFLFHYPGIQIMCRFKRLFQFFSAKGATQNIQIALETVLPFAYYYHNICLHSKQNSSSSYSTDPPPYCLLSCSSNNVSGCNSLF